MLKEINDSAVLGRKSDNCSIKAAPQEILPEAWCYMSCVDREDVEKRDGVTRFGKLLKELMKLADLKNAALAQSLNYDVSNISKWTASNKLPSARSIEKICRVCGQLCASRTLLHEEQIRSLLGETAEELRAMEELISRHLYKAYERDLQERYVAMESQMTARAVPACNKTEGKRQQLYKLLQEHRTVSERVTVYVVARLYDLSFDDYIGLMDLHYHIQKLNFASVKIRYFVEESASLSRAQCGVGLMNLLMLRQMDVEFYSVKARCCGLAVCVEDLALYSAQMIYREKWTLETLCTERESITAFVQYIRWELYALRIRLFEYIPEPSEHMDIIRYEPFSLREELSISSQVNQLIVDDSMLSYILERDCSLPPQVCECMLKKQQRYMERLQHGESVRLLLYRSALDQLIYQGKLALGGYCVQIPLERRVQILESVWSQLSRFSQLQIKIIEGYLVDEIKHECLPDYWMSATGGVFQAYGPGGQRMIHCIRSQPLSNVIRNTLEQIWEEKLLPLGSATDTFCTYMDICNELVFLN